MPNLFRKSRTLNSSARGKIVRFGAGRFTEIFRITQIFSHALSAIIKDVDE